MNCKNCNKKLNKEDEFCSGCGAKIVVERITAKKLLFEMLGKVFGWDNKYFKTLKMLLFKPDRIFTEYLDGTRKKYVNPFAFFAIGVAVALLIFNGFSKEYLELSGGVGEQQVEMIDKKIVANSSEALSENKIPDDEINSSKRQSEQFELNEKIQKTVLKYFNIFSFLLLPLYGLVAFLVYRKPYNYGEHLVINAYIQGVTFLITIIFFIASMFTSPSIYYASTLVMMLYYTYAYGKLYKLSLGRSLIKLLKFLGVLLMVVLLFVLIMFVVGIVIGLFMNK